MLIEEITDRLNGLEILIEERIKDIETVSNFIAKNTIQLNQLEYELDEVEFDIRTSISNWKDVGCNNKEERELYVKTRDEYKLILFDIQRINNDIIEYKHTLDVAEKELKFYNRMYDRYSKLEDNTLSKICKSGDNCGCR